MKELIKIGTTPQGDISFEVNPDAPLHSIVGALQLVKKVLEAKMVSDTLSDKGTTKTINHETNS